MIFHFLLVAAAELPNEQVGPGRSHIKFVHEPLRFLLLPTGRNAIAGGGAGQSWDHEVVLYRLIKRQALDRSTFGHQHELLPQQSRGRTDSPRIRNVLPSTSIMPPARPLCAGEQVRDLFETGLFQPGDPDQCAPGKVTSEVVDEPAR